MFLLCNHCSELIPMPMNLSEKISCERCGNHLHHLKQKSATMTLALSLTALICYIPANMLPFMTMELYGVKNSATIWSGVVQLAEAGSLFVAIVVFLASIFIPLVKLIILIYLSVQSKMERERDDRRSRTQTHLYRFIEIIGRWSMLDIFLLAVLVAIMKFGPWTTVNPEPGALMFALVVIFTMLASECFEPRLLWRKTYVIEEEI